jgi:hypothetical protein
MDAIEHLRKAEAVAEKIAAKAEDALANLDREMIIMKWPQEFRVIMWDAVAHAASLRAADARS